MKKILFLIVVSIFISCTEDDNPSNDINQTISRLNQTVSSGNWIISYFFDSDSDETSNFSGFEFSFNNEGSLIAQNGNLIYSGTWSIIDSNSNDDSNDDVDFNIVFTTPAEFMDLSDDWDVINITDSKIELIDVSGGNGGTDYLTFER